MPCGMSSTSETAPASGGAVVPPQAPSSPPTSGEAARRMTGESESSSHRIVVIDASRIATAPTTRRFASHSAGRNRSLGAGAQTLYDWDQVMIGQTVAAEYGHRAAEPAVWPRGSEPSPGVRPLPAGPAAVAGRHGRDLPGQAR